MTVRVLTVLLLASLASVATAAAPPAVKLSVRSDRLFLPVELNGRQVEALLDSAAESSLIDPVLAAELALPVSGQATARGSGGQQEARFTRVSVQAASLRLNNITVAVVDLSDVSKRLVGAPVRFILGRELFDAARLRIDIEQGSLQVVDRRAPVSGVALPLTSHDGIESLPARAEGIAAAADFDLGNGRNVLIGKAFAGRTGLLAARRVIGTRSGGGIGGQTVRQVLRLATLEVAGTRFTDVEADVDALDNAGDLNLGVKILRRFVMVTDFAQHRIWLQATPADAATPP